MWRLVAVLAVISAGCGGTGGGATNTPPSVITPARNPVATWESTAPADFDHLYDIVAKSGRAMISGARDIEKGQSAKATCEVLARELEDFAGRLVPIPRGVNLEAEQIAFIGELMDRARKGLRLCQTFDFLNGAKALTGANADQADAMSIRVRDALKRT